MHILVTNDDGIGAPGLLALNQALKSVADTTVFAPSRNWSASGHVKTMHKPLRVSETRLADHTPALTTSGAPSDCVVLAFLGIVERPIDMVVSGINQGANLGHDVTYSVSVTSAIEGAIAWVMVTRMGLLGYYDELIRGVDPKGYPYYWITEKIRAAVWKKGRICGR